MVPRTEYVNISWILKPCKTRCFQRPYIRFLHPTSCFRTMYNKMLPKDQTDFTWCVKIRVFIESICFDRSCRVAAIEIEVNYPQPKGSGLLLNGSPD